VPGGTVELEGVEDRFVVEPFAIAKYPITYRQYGSRLARTTAVGMYPQTSSPHGVFDLAGNVWEWCLNKYELPRDCKVSGTGPRVVRGGSWRGDRSLARCVGRHDHDPGGRRYFNLGFRVVRVSPI